MTYLALLVFIVVAVEQLAREGVPGQVQRGQVR
jgi:hypothetical protein